MIEPSGFSFPLVLPFGEEFELTTNPKALRNLSQYQPKAPIEPASFNPVYRTPLA
jgi:hypothetical protein